jgi:pyruvate formate lyase activating enzyme
MREAMFYEKMENGKVHCFLCSHHCKIAPSFFGICGVRQNINGSLFTRAYGGVIAESVDPIEKKPLFNFLPGSSSYSIATVGCNFKCGFCQNWQISQVSSKNQERIWKKEMTASQIVQNAEDLKCKSISFTYSEPTIFFEYAFEIARIAKEKGIHTVFVTNGYATEQVIEIIKPYLSACNVDLKSFSNDFYNKYCQARLSPVLDYLKRIKNAGIWLEITTLIIPGENDSDHELNEIAEFIAKLGTDTPWHVSRFFPNYEFTDHPPTPVSTINQALKIGESYGLKFVYPGNLNSEVETKCPRCKSLLISRDGYKVKINNISSGKCPICSECIPGIFKY